MPLISVIVPIYNVENYLKRCLDSLLCQNFSDCEILLVDDGSTDTSGRIADCYDEEYENVTAYHKKNGGLASARNFGMEKARGKYVAFVDSDDYVLPHYFKFLAEHLQKNADILKFGYQRIRNGVPGKNRTPYFDEGLYTGEQILADILPGAVGPRVLFDYRAIPVMSAWASVYSMDFLKRNKIMFVSEREILSEDYLFNLHALLKAETVLVTHGVLYQYDYRDGSLSKRYIENMAERKTALLSCYKKLLTDEGVYERLEIPYYSQCIDTFYACVNNECRPWNTTSVSTSVRHIREILNLELCTEAFKKVKPVNLSKRGFILFFLMKYKMSLSIFLLYRATKNVLKV